LNATPERRERQNREGRPGPDGGPGGGPGEGIGEGDGAADRRAAAELVRAVLEQGRSFDRAWAEAATGAAPGAATGSGCLAGLDERDRAFVRALSMTVLRHLRQIDGLVDACLDRPLRPGRSADPARSALRLGAAQILFLDIPDHAAVHASVALLPARSPFRGLVNAVLRRIAAAPRPPQGDAGANLPDWLRQAWIAHYGATRAEALAAASLAEAPLDLSVRSDPAGWAERLQAQVLPNGSLRRPAGGRVEALPGFAEGGWWVQDAAAAIPAQVLARAADGLAGGLAGQAVLDMCAAPGGKTAQLAAMGAQVTALERDPQRAERLAANLRRLDLAAELVIADAALWRGGPAEGFAAILLDAPCSATGTLRRHPDILHLRRPSDIPVAAALQDRLIDAGIARLRPGGLLVYCVCSLQPEEGEARLAAALNRHANRVAQVALAPAEYGLPEAAACGNALRTAPDLWPEQGGMDGFFIALLRRTA